MQQPAAVIELFVLRQGKAERIGAAQDDVHATSSEDVGQQGRALDEVVKGGHLVDEDALDATCLEGAQVFVELG